MRPNVMTVVNAEIELLEERMNAENKHLISTETLRDAVLMHVDINCGNEDTEYLAKVGFSQIIQRGLYEHGYRSVRQGHFVNLDVCMDVDYLVALVENENTLVKEKIIMERRLREIRDSRLDGQIFFDENGNYVIPMNEDEFMEKIIADAV